MECLWLCCEFEWMVRGIIVSVSILCLNFSSLRRFVSFHSGREASCHHNLYWQPWQMHHFHSFGSTFIQNMIHKQTIPLLCAYPLFIICIVKQRTMRVRSLSLSLSIGVYMICAYLFDALLSYKWMDDIGPIAFNMCSVHDTVFNGFSSSINTFSLGNIGSVRFFLWLFCFVYIRTFSCVCVCGESIINKDIPCIYCKCHRQSAKTFAKMCTRTTNTYISIYPNKERDIHKYCNILLMMSNPVTSWIFHTFVRIHSIITTAEWKYRTIFNAEFSFFSFDVVATIYSID